MESVLADIKQLASEVVPEGGKALLYGSRARGTAHMGSDWALNNESVGFFYRNLVGMVLSAA